MPLLLALLPTAAPAAAEAPQPTPALGAEVRAVIEAAIESRDAAAVAAVVRFAKQAHPEASAEIDVLHQAFLADAAARAAREAEDRRRQLAAASPLEHWEGSIEFGASRSTGSASNLGFFGAVTAQRNGIEWRHRIAARAEIQETNGARTAERVLAEWQPRRTLGERSYGFGLAQFERDPFLGFSERYTLGLGAGYSLVNRSDVRLELEGGPSIRRTSRDGRDLSTFAGRASLDLTWRLSPTLEVKQNGSLFLEQERGSGRASTALDAVLIGPLRVRLSYELRYERDTLRTLDSLDTTSRATFVFGL